MIVKRGLLGIRSYSSSQSSQSRSQSTLSSKKGQVAVFLIIAVVLLLLIGGYFLFQNYLNHDKLPTDLADSSLTPVQKFVLGCVDKSIRNGLQIAADQGGYIQLPREIASNPSLYVSPHPDAPVKTPVWYVNGNSYVPTANQVQDQLASYVDQTIGYCLANLSNIAEISQVSIDSIPRATVSLNERDVTVKLNYSVSYTQRGATQTENQFTYVLSVPFKQMLDDAQQIATQISNDAFLEQATIDLLSSANDAQIPLSNMRLQCSRPTWKTADVQSNITQLLYQMVPRIRIKGAEGIPFDADPSTYANLQRITPDDFSDPAVGAAPIKQKVPRGYADAPQDAYEYNHLYYDAGNSDQLKSEGVTVSFNYLPNYGLDMQVRPSQNGVMSGTDGKGNSDYLKFLCFQVYHFTYDLMFPVQVTVVKDNAFRDGSSLALRFATRVQIQSNQPNRNNFEMTTSATTPGGELCDPKVDHQTLVTAVDKISGQAINGATVEFHCYKYACDLGTTNTNASYQPQLITAIPSFCTGGSVAVSQPNYISAESAFYDAPQQLQLQMWPLRNVSFDVMLGPNPAQLGGQSTVSASALNDNQQAVVQVTSNNLDYQTYTAYQPGSSSALQLIGAAGTYNVTVYVYETTDGQDAALVGAYTGTLNVRNANLNQHLRFYAYDYINPLSSDQIADKMKELATDDVIKGTYQPGWI